MANQQRKSHALRAAAPPVTERQATPEDRLRAAVLRVFDCFEKPTTWAERNERRKELHRAVDGYYSDKTAGR
jgi:hypothetical protein